jgi:TPR repeat protein
MILALAVSSVIIRPADASEPPKEANEVADYLETYRAGAQAGVPEDEYNLGGSYRWGVGMERNLTLAIQWIRKAAEQGYPPAERTIGEMYEKGEGLTVNLDEAMGWYRSAARHGDSDGQKDLAALEVKMRMVTPGARDPALEPTLEIVVSGSTRTITLAELERRLHSVQLTVYNPAYKRSMTYEGFWLDQILDILKVKLGRQDVVFRCADGYGTSMAADEIGRQKWLMAYAEPQGWTPLPGHAPPMLPGPWYVIGRDPDSFKQTPWPYQVVEIRIQGDW